MSQKKVVKTLMNLGLSELDAQVYIFLGKKGPRKGREISKALKLSKQKVYSAIKNLQGKGILTATFEHPAKFSVLPFEKTLDLFAKAKMEEAMQIEGVKPELLSDWKKVTIDEVDQSPKFTILEGRNFIYSKLKQMIEETEDQISVISSLQDLLRADQFGLFSVSFSQSSKTNVKFRILTELSKENLTAMEGLLDKIPKTTTNFDVRIPEFGIKLPSRMLIKDEAEVAFFLSQTSTEAAKEVDDICLWTNSNAMVTSFMAVFDGLWRNSTPIKTKIMEIETGNPATKTCIIENPEAAKKAYAEAEDAAEKEIFMVTSSNGLIEIWRNIARMKKRADKGVSINIMAPITNDNLEAALQLSKHCRVRHVPSNYPVTTIIDGKKLFQFKNPPSEEEKKDDSISFENTFYSSDREYIKKTTTMLAEVWSSAVKPSSVTVGETMKPLMRTIIPVPEGEYVVSKKDSPYQKMTINIEEKPLTVTEEYVLRKIIRAKKSPCKNPFKDPARFYGSDATAVIRTPKEFGLPDMILVFLHCNKQSSFGAEDCFHVYLWMETPNGNAFVPVASAGDNPESMERRKEVFAGTPASQNIHVIEKEQLKITIHGNTLFAGWTVAIPLFPKNLVLPPASVLFEGYGKIKPDAFTISMPSGTKVMLETNNLDAFVTFFHPAKKYSGPGTDGTFARDMIMTVYPPPQKNSK